MAKSNADFNILLENFRNGDQTAFDEIYMRCCGHIAFVCSKICYNKEDVEEIVQDTFMAAFKKADELRGDTLLALLRKIAVRKCYNNYNNKKIKPEHVTYEGDANPPDVTELNGDFLPEEYLQNKEMQAELLQIINVLPPTQREVVYLYYYADINTEEIARLKNCTAATKVALALGIFLALSGDLSFTSPAMGETITPAKTDALNSYDNALSHFKSILGERRAQINSNQRLPNLPGQALYVARINLMSAYKDFTDAVPSKIGRPNKFGIPPEYFDADNEPLFDEYGKLFDLMEAPPAGAQFSATPFKDIVDLGIAIARAKGLDATNADAAGRISLGLFFAETNGHQNIGNARSNTYKGSLQTGPSEDRNGRKKWQEIKKVIAAFDPELSARDAKEEARAGDLDHRFNHWTAVRDALMNAHADLFPQIPVIVKKLPNPIDQMKVFELIQIIPTPTRSALKSGSFVDYRVSDPAIMRYLRNNGIFALGQADRARTSATFREILDAMWLFNKKFERALSKFDEITRNGSAHDAPG